MIEQPFIDKSYSILWFSDVYCLLQDRSSNPASPQMEDGGISFSI